MIDGDVRNVPCPTCGEVMNGWLAFGSPEQVTFCNTCETVDDALVWLTEKRVQRCDYVSPIDGLRCTRGKSHDAGHLIDSDWLGVGPKPTDRPRPEDASNA